MGASISYLDSELRIVQWLLSFKLIQLSKLMKCVKEDNNKSSIPYSNMVITWKWFVISLLKGLLHPNTQDTVFLNRITANHGNPNLNYLLLKTLCIRANTFKKTVLLLLLIEERRYSFKLSFPYLWPKIIISHCLSDKR